jgi:hypothetical protein
MIYISPLPLRCLQRGESALARAGYPKREASKMWAYRFEKRLPAHLNLGPVVQRSKDRYCIEAEGISFL